MRLTNYEIELGFIKDFFDMYNQIGKIDEVNELLYPTGFHDFLKLTLNTVGYGDKLTRELKTQKEKISLSNVNDKVLIGFSSGFDSTYQALKLKHEGYEPVLFHINSLNKSYPDEATKANEFAEMYNFEIINIEIEENINKVFIDNPIKNQMILSLMIDYGYKNEINKFALGNNIRENIEECRVQYGISDSIQMFQIYRDSLSRYISNAIFFDIQETKSDAYNFVGTLYPKALVAVNSCITPHRFKKHLNKLNSEKFGIVPLSDNRCMSCYKCAIEAILLDYNDIVQYDEKYLNHSYNIIRKKSDTIFTTKIANKKSNNEEILKELLQC